MKKVFSLLLVFFLTIYIQNVYASSFNAKITGNDTFEKEITLNLQVNNLSGFEKSACKGLCGLVGKLNYDSTKIELSSIKALQGFDLTQGSKIVLYKTTGVGSGTKILEMKFKNKALKKDETTNISFTSIVGSDGDNDISAANASKTIKLIVKATATPTPKTSTNTTKNTTKTTDTKTTTVKKSNNSNLKSITLSNGSIEFKEDITSYEITVGNEVEKINIDAQVSDSKATITNTGEHELNEGNNVIELVVKAEDGTTKKYTITINREKQEVATSPVVVEPPKEESEPEKGSNNYLTLILIAVAAVVIGVVSYIVLRKKVQ